MSTLFDNCIRDSDTTKTVLPIDPSCIDGIFDSFKQAKLNISWSAYDDCMKTHEEKTSNISSNPLDSMLYYFERDLILLKKEGSPPYHPSINIDKHTY